ncbi:MAG: hypothetical protein LAO04_05315 [Acidobacteriia bacterium]|nr:hypothetical protein [Terriglobia bacterium]
MSVGFRVREVSAEGYLSSKRESDLLLIVPEPEGLQLDGPLVQTILHDVERGMPLLLDGAAPLAAALGVNATGTRGEITRYRWARYAEDLVRLPGRLAYTRFKGNPALQALAFDPKDKAPLVVSGSRGQGRFIHSAIPLEPPEGMVFEYLPFLAQAIVDELRVAPTLAADNLCVYLDVGGELDPIAVAAQLKSWSVREVHLAAFYDSEAFHEFTRRFIPAAHLEGMAVYAWLEYPMVGEQFWKQHPEWREVTASGQPAIMDWRSHMALEDPACLRAVVEHTRRLVLDHDWDGVDFAELYFEGAPGIFKYPEDFTPMHPTFRKMFQQRYGVDPLELFNPQSPHYGPRDGKMRRALHEYRIELITGLTETFLDTLARCQAEKPYLQTTLTIIDALRDPTVTERFAVDPERLLALQKKYSFAVEIEDPYTVWNESPDRYRAIGEHYRPRLQPGTPFSIDVNVVDRVPPGRPLNKPRGLELYELVANVAANVDLLTLFGFSTLPADDMRLVPFVLGAQQMTSEAGDGTPVQVQRQLYWRTDTRGRTAYLDGREWPGLSDSKVLIPAGAHSVSTRPQAAGAGPSALRIESITGTILGAERAGKRVTFTYESRGRCYVTLNRQPAMVLCDGASGLGKILSNGGHVCLVLPQGKHSVEIE